MAHAVELPHVWGNYDGALLRAADRRMTDAMQQYWTNLAKHGDPNGAGGDGRAAVAWPRYDAATDRHLRLADPPTAAHGYAKAGCDFWDALPAQSDYPHAAS